MAIQIISTDFDGTLHTELENPPIPHLLQTLLGGLQTRGVTWVINTGRDLASLTQTLDELGLSVKPDYVVTVEREIYKREQSDFLPLPEWNARCHEDHKNLFTRVAPLIPPLAEWILANFNLTVYEDPFSPFCLIANSPAEADAICQHLESVTREVPDLAVVRNHIYIRFSHSAYNKGTALAEIMRRLNISADSALAAGDHYNDLPMLQRQHARWLIAPDNAIAEVKEAVRRQSGYVSTAPYGTGVARGLEYFLESTIRIKELDGIGG